MADTEGWRRCSSCREWIPFQTAYYVCNVSTCNRKNTAFVFCTVDCWDTHLPTMNHREAWAEEKRSPSAQQWAAEQRAEPRASKPRAARAAAPTPAPKPASPSVIRRPAGSAERVTAVSTASAPSAGGAALSLDDGAPDEILIVASRLKEYIRARSGMNTSDRVLAPLSDIIREVCDRAIQNAHRDERKTVLDRDVPKPRS